MVWLVNLIWYLPGAAIAFGLFYLVWSLVLRVFRFRSKPARLASVPVFVAFVFAFWLYATRPNAVYSEAFGFPVSTDVRDLKSDRFLVGQSGRLYLRFRADPSTIERIIDRGLVLVETNDVSLFRWDQPKGDVPSWWRVQDLGTSAQFYHATTTNKNSYDSINEYFAYDRSSGIALFKRFDID